MVPAPLTSRVEVRSAVAANREWPQPVSKGSQHAVAPSERMRHTWRNARTAARFASTRGLAGEPRDLRGVVLRLTRRLPRRTREPVAHRGLRHRRAEEVPLT